jgi:type II secretion system protein N
MPDWREFLTLDYWREHAIVAAYALAGLVLFLVFIVGTFPYDQALTGVLMPLGFKLSYQDEHPAFPIGAVLEDVNLISLEQPSTPPLISSESLKLTPGLGTLIGRPGVAIHADLYGGTAWVSVRRSGDLTQLFFDLSNINMGSYPLPPQAGASLKGIVSGGGNFAIMDHTASSQQGSLTLDGHDVDFALIKGLPSLRFSNLKGSLQLDGPTLRINALEGSGPDMKVSGSGLIHLGPTVASSMMELTLLISPTVAGRAHLGVLFAFLPHPPDKRPYLFHGPLLMPAVN